MVFTTQTFLFVFFPVCMLGYYFSLLLTKTKTAFARFLKKCRLPDLAIIGVSCAFYVCAGVSDAFRLILYVCLVWILGAGIQAIRNKNYFVVAEHKEKSGEPKQISIALPLFVLAIGAVGCVLVYYKYTHMLADIWNMLFNGNAASKSILAPLGISFITFSSVSYLSDVYTEKAKAGSLIDCALYLLFFPKIVSGPIVLWRDFSGQIAERKINLNSLSDGASRMMIGFVKKVVLADTFGACLINASVGNIDMCTAWGTALLYALQIYYDFSGYSDIAIGISKMFGFSFKENFNFPYLSCSITEFWRRWHISLGSWFREYVYFPLGGSRKGKARTVVNVAIVFLLTGIWHGGGETYKDYIVWGMINGACNIVEKLISEKRWYQKTPAAIKWLCTMGITLFCWELFFNGFSLSLVWLKTIFGLNRASSIPYTWQYFFDKRTLVLMIIAIAGATVFGLPKIQNAYHRAVQKPFGYAVHQTIVVVLFVVSILFMVNATYSPFIYFQY